MPHVYSVIPGLLSFEPQVTPEWLNFWQLGVEPVQSVETSGCTEDRRGRLPIDRWVEEDHDEAGWDMAAEISLPPKVLSL
jgi:hypothetical protein